MSIEPDQDQVIWEANRGQTMPSGRRFSVPQRIYPGDVLCIPEQPGQTPRRLVDHVVQPDETLRAIAARYLGDERAWPVIFEANRGRPAPGNRFLLDPDLIWPGMTLRIPLATSVATPDSPPPPVPVEPGRTNPTVDRPPITGEPTSEPVGTARPAREPEREAAEMPAARAREQAAAEAEARANAARAGRPITPVAGPPETADSAPVVVQPAATPAATGARPLPFTADDIPLSGVLAGSAMLLAAVGYLALRRHLAADGLEVRQLPFHLSGWPGWPGSQRPHGDAAQGNPTLGPLARQRRRGIEADARVAVVTPLLEAVAEAGWPAAQVVSLTEQPERLAVRLRLGDLTAADRENLQTALDEAFDALISLTDGPRGDLCIILRQLEAVHRWQAGARLPLAPLATIGQSDDGSLAVALDSLAGGLVIAGEQAVTALERVLLSLVALYPPATLRLVLLVGEPLASALAPLPHLLQPPLPATADEAGRLLEGVHEEMRARKIGADAGGALIVLVIEQPDVLDGPLVREVLRDGGAVGIYGIIISPAPTALDAGLLAACPGRLITRLPTAPAEPSTRPAWLANADDLMDEQASWRLTGEPRQTLRLLPVDPADRAALFQAMTAPAPAPAPLDGDVTDEPADDGDDDGGDGNDDDDGDQATDGADDPGERPAEPVFAAVRWSDDAAITAVTHGITSDQGQPDMGALANSAARPMVEAVASAPGVAAFPIDLPAEALCGPRPGQLILRLFGFPALFAPDGQPIAFPRNMMGLRLLLALALAGEQGVPAEGLDEQIWRLSDGEDELNDSDPANKVRKAIKRLRDHLAPFVPAGGDSILFRNSLYRLDPAVIWCDAVAFKTCLTRARRVTTDAAAMPLWREALASYQQPLADKAPERWVDPVWIDSEREHYQHEARKAALNLAAALARAEDYAGAVALYERLRSLSIVDDDIAECELICQALRGEPPEQTLLTRSYQQHTAALARLGMHPRRATSQLYERLLAGAVSDDLIQRVRRVQQH